MLANKYELIGICCNFLFIMECVIIIITFKNILKCVKKHCLFKLNSIYYIKIYILIKIAKESIAK